MKTMNRIAATAAVMGSLVLSFTSPAQAESKKIWFCHAVCVAVDSEGQRIQLAGSKPPEGYGKYRMDAYKELADLCAQRAERLGFPEAILASRFSYRTEHDRSKSESWSVYARDFSFANTSSSYDNEDEREHHSGFWRYDSRSRERRSGSESDTRVTTRERARSGSESFSSHDGLNLSVDPARMTDSGICSQEIVAADWEPEYQSLPGDGTPRG